MPFRARCGLCNIVASGLIGTTGIFISSQNSLYTSFGTDPSSMTPPARVTVNADQIVQSKRSLVAADNMLIYSGVDGLCGVDQNGNVTVLTVGIFNRSDWQAFNPPSISAWYWNGLYVASYNNGTPGGFIYDLRNNQFQNVTFYAQAGYHDKKNGALFLMINNSGTQQVMQFDGNTASPMTFNWRSRIVRFDQEVGFGVADISCQGGPFTFTTYLDGSVRDVVTVYNGVPFRLADGKGYEWEVSITGTGRVEAIHLATSFKALIDVAG